MRAPVVIIGGGIYGLAAATRLQAHGIPIAILEAKPRLGCRIHTIWEGPLPVELGAEFIHGRSPALLSVIRNAGLPTRSVPNRHCLDAGGTTSSVDPLRLIAKVIGTIKSRKPDRSFQRFLDEHEFDDRSRQLALGYVEGFNAAHAGRISCHALIPELLT